MALASFICALHLVASTGKLLVSRPRIPQRVKYYPPLDLFNCDGANFSSSWRDFRLAVAENARAGFPQDRELLATARQIYLERQEEAMARSMMQVRVLLKQNEVADLRDFCLFGFATALFIIFRHDLDVNHLLSIQSLMGWAEWPLDFSEASGWPVLWRIVPLHLERAQQYGSTSWSADFRQWGREEDLLPNPSLTQVEAFLLQWLGNIGVPCPRQLDGLTAAGRMDEKEALMAASALRSAASGRARRLQVLVAGHHMGSSMEPFTMLQQAITVGLRLEIEAQFHGQRHPSPNAICVTFGYCNEGSALNKWFRRYESRWVGEFEWMEDQWPDALEELATALREDDFVANVDFVICGGPAWVCAMIRGVKAVPMLLYFAWPLVPMIPVRLRPHFLWQIQALGQTVEPATVFVSANWVLTVQFALQVRLAVPVQRVHGLYVNESYAPVPAPNGFRRIVFSRLGQWTKQAGPALLEVIWGLVKEEQRERVDNFPFELVFLSIRVRGIKPILHASYAEFAQFHAAVFWPWDMMMMLFSELYTMTMPLLVPDRHWVSNIILHSIRHTEVNWWHVRAESVAGGLPSAASEDFPLPSEPWLDENAGVEEACFWYSLTEFEHYPHLTRFGSLPEMLERIRHLDVSTIRAGMQQFNRATLQNSLAFYREAAARLLS